MKQYKDWFTLDGRLRPVAGVTKRKVEAVRDLVTESLHGSRIALGTLTEAVTTSDASINLAHLMNIEVLPQYEEQERNWRQFSDTTRFVSDFRPVTLYEMSRSWEGGVLGDGDPVYVAPTVPEGAPYPYATLGEAESGTGPGVTKRGFKFGFTFEAFINDTLGVIRQMPQEMLNVALDTEEWQFFSALFGGLRARTNLQLAGGVTPDGYTVAANAKISRSTLLQAKIELSQRTLNGRLVTSTGGYNVFVAPGRKLAVDFLLRNLGVVGAQAGVYELSVSNWSPVDDIEVFESEYVSGNEWFMTPKPGGSRRPLISDIKLIGHEAPEIRVHNLTGNYQGGGPVSPFEGSFDTDTADFRIRMIGSAALWTPELAIWSTGAGNLPTAPTTVPGA